MLAELTVENYAVVERVRVRFHPGLNMLTGETGSGKSIVVDALMLLYGGRGSAEMIRTGAERARVAGIFEVGGLKLPEGIEAEDGELIIEREILANGKSRAFVGGRPVTSTLLRELSAQLGDIHGQHDQQLLFSPVTQREMLDAFAGVLGLVEETGALYSEWRARSAELSALEASEQENLRQADLWSFQKQEIDELDPRPGEDGALENERRILRNVVKLQETAGSAYEALHEDPSSVTVQVRAILKRLEELSRIDDSAAEMVATLEPASIALEEAATALRHYLEKLEADPAKLDEVETRLAALEKLKRKYGATVEDILAFRDEAAERLAAVENSGERQAALKKEVQALALRYEAAAGQLTKTRTQAAAQLAKRTETELAALAMPHTRVEIRVSPTEWSASGSDAVAIWFSPNPGEEPKPLEKIASGGELSRVALALKTSAVPAKTAPAKEAKPSKTQAAMRTLVFDEVDAGVGGSAAEAVGRRLKKLSTGAQVLCVTHLAQIAGFADHHYSVEKLVERGRTATAIHELDAKERTQEIGRMLSGERVTAEALKHAEQLLKAAKA